MLSIGSLARATGIPVATLRTWERRYGFPEPERRASGHRRYPLSTVDRLRDVRRAVDLGHKPSAVLNLNRPQLRQLLQVAGDAPLASVSRLAAGAIADWLDAVRLLDADLNRLLNQVWDRHGARRFVVEAALPFLNEVGDRWERGDLDVMHEHFASEQMRDFLTSKWRPMSARASGPRVIAANLPAEQHDLGLHLATVLMALADLRVTFLGPNTPLPDIARAVRDGMASALVVGLSPCADPDGAGADLATLRHEVDGAVEIVTGGNKRPIEMDGVRWLEDLEGLESWAGEVAQRLEGGVVPDVAAGI